MDKKDFDSIDVNESVSRNSFDFSKELDNFNKEIDKKEKAIKTEALDIDALDKELNSVKNKGSQARNQTRNRFEDMDLSKNTLEENLTNNANINKMREEAEKKAQRKEKFKKLNFFSKKK